MPDLDEMIDQLRRMRANPGGPVKDWYRISAKAASRKAEVRIYDDIGWMGTSAKTFAEEIAALDVDEIDLRLNSPGGDAWDGVAIYNTLRKHPATVTVTVDGMAASAASVIAMAGDRVLMNRGSQLMIHDAWGLTVGNAEDMADAALMLGKMSDSLADIYAARAGGTSDDWRTAMRAESWYTAAEAVEAGLADALVDDTAEPDAKARYDLRAYAFAYAGRSAAPAPTITPRPAAPTTSADPAGNPKTRGAGMDPAKIREALGLAATAPDDEVRTALAKAGLASTSTPSATPEVDDEPDDEPEAPKAKAKPKAKPQAQGTMTIDVTAWEERENRIKALEARAAKQQVKERDEIIAQAVIDGKFAPARKDHWARLWDADPEGTRDLLGSLAKNVVPTAEMGYSLDAETDLDDEFKQLFSNNVRKG